MLQIALTVIADICLTNYNESISVMSVPYSHIQTSNVRRLAIHYSKTVRGSSNSHFGVSKTLLRRIKITALICVMSVPESQI